MDIGREKSFMKAESKLLQVSGEADESDSESDERLAKLRASWVQKE